MSNKENSIAEFLQQKSAYDLSDEQCDTLKNKLGQGLDSFNLHPEDIIKKLN